MNGTASTVSHLNILTILFFAGVITKSFGLNALWVSVTSIMAVYLGVREFGIWSKNLLPVAFIFAAAIMVVSTLLGNDSNEDRFIYIGYAASFCMLLFIGYIVVTTRDRNYLIAGLKQINILLVLFSVFGVIEYIIRDNPLKDYFDVYYNLSYVGSERFRSCSVFAHSIPFAVSTLIGIAITFYFVKNRYAKWIAITLFTVALFCTKSRSCWLVFLLMIVGIVITEIRARGFSRTVLVITPMIIIAACLVSQPIIDAVSDRFSSLLTSGSFLHRSGAADYILQRFISEGNILIGSGYGSAEAEMSKTVIYEAGFDAVDNGLITILYDFGLLVLMQLLAALCCGLAVFLNEHSSNIERCFSLILLISISTGFVFEFFGWQCVSIFFFVSLAYTVYRGNYFDRRGQTA